MTSLLFSLIVFLSCLLFNPSWSSAIKSTTQLNNIQQSESFFDNYFKSSLEKFHVPGVALSLVRGDTILLSKGYGLGNLDQRTVVNPARTIFRVGSVSKLLTTTAVLQLADRSKINLDEDVRPYLKNLPLKNPITYPVTWRDLLTHTDGFDSGWGIGSFARSPSQMLPLKDYISRRLPRQLHQPGQVYLYSDVGMTLAGYLVEKATGIPFAQYVEDNIFQPLKMSHSSFGQFLNSNLATGYRYRENQYRAFEYPYINSVSAGALSTTATDMAHFAIAQLQGGIYKAQRILSDRMVEQMQSRQFTVHPLFSGSAFGFYERFWGKYRILEHGGRMSGYQSLLFLIPQEDIGFFITCNTDNYELLDDLVTRFLTQYFPKEEGDVRPTLQQSQTQLRELAGTYRYNRYAHNSIEKLGAVLGEAPETNLVANPNRSLSLGQSGQQWREVSPMLFQESESKRLMAFPLEREPKYLFLSHSVFSVLEKLQWFETVTFQVRLILGCLSVFILVLIKTLLGWKRLNFRDYLVLWLILGNFFFILCMVWYVIKTEFWEFFWGLPLWVQGVLHLPFLSIISSLILLMVIVNTWAKLSICSRFEILSLITANGLFIWCLHYWNLIGVRL